MDWRHRALCRDEDPELFFPIGTTGPAVTQIEQAKAVCHRCPVVQSCLEWALTSGQDSGGRQAACHCAPASQTGASPVMGCSQPAHTGRSGSL